MKLKRFKYIAFSAFYLFLAGFISAADHHEEETKYFGKSEYRSGFSTHSRGRGRGSFSTERGEHKETPAEYTARKERIAQEKFERSLTISSTHSRGRGRGSFSAERGEQKETPEEYAQRHKELAERKHKELIKRKFFDPKTGKILVKLNPLPPEWYHPSPSRVVSDSDGDFASKITSGHPYRQSKNHSTSITGDSSVSRISDNVFGVGTVIDGVYIAHNEV